ncbi:MAG: hypothetical protein VB081_10570 [Christensenella sp.]|uniref:hypothetical protein n=1 Tax=Christensenella sp. TaxID=1935934 RepID=UPI002B1EBC88|nr:hypothetical protein [Christensenella sp.]MEA5003930.1 hypothetical protein [Christensenella sp.]
MKETIQKKQSKIVPVLLVIFGALAYLILLPQIWWLGLAFAALAVIWGGITLRKYNLFSVIAMLLGIVACLIYVFSR